VSYIGRKRFIKILSVVCMILILFTGCGDNRSTNSDSNEVDWTEYDARAIEFITLLMDGDYDRAAEGFDTVMKMALNAPTLAKVWEDTTAKAGAYIETVGIDHSKEQGYFICTVKTRHENTGIASRIVFNAKLQISGLFFNYIDLSEAKANDGFTEIEVIVGEGSDYPLNGILTLPENASGKIPAVVLVHGSGPSDMDESAYGIKIFKDIAEHLSKDGIAVLRYDKRTYAHGAKLTEKYGANLKGFTVFEETIEDALLAKELLTKNDKIDPERIYVLGHSLGGMLAPRIMTEGNFAGAILLAGSPRSLLDIIYDQNMYFINIGEYSDAEKAELIEQVNSAARDYFGLSREYIDDMDSHSAKDYITKTDKPMLIMQGGKDFQVSPDADFELYRKIAEGKSNITLKYYENLNHFFTLSKMKNPTTDDYMPGSHMDSEPLRDLSEWLKG
jgi:dienelactone hydrolase